jgi:hypothetical protein
MMNMYGSRGPRRAAYWPNGEFEGGVLTTNHEIVGSLRMKDEFFIKQLRLAANVKYLNNPATLHDQYTASSLFEQHPNPTRTLGSLVDPVLATPGYLSRNRWLGPACRFSVRAFYITWKPSLIVTRLLFDRMIK